MPDGGLPPDAGAPDGGGDGGFSTAFGEACSTTKACTPPFSCTFLTPTETKGFCSKTCPKIGTTCSGAVPGLGAFCLLQDNSTNFCAFLCKDWNAKTYTCPSQLTCATQDTPPGSGQRLCVP